MGGTTVQEKVDFIDENTHAFDGVEIDYHIVGTIEDWQPKGDEEFALDIGFTALKRKIVAELKDRGAKFASIIHPIKRWQL